MATDFLDAVRKGDTERVRSLLRGDPSLTDAQDDKGLSAVVIAAYNGHSNLAKELASQKQEPNIFEVSTTGNLRLVGELLQRNPALANCYSVDGFTPLHLAAFFGHIEATKLLLTHQAQINAVAKNPMKVMPLHSAIARNEMPLIQLLVENGADVNAKQEGGFTPLHGAAQNGNLQATILLLSHGADINVRTESGITPLALTTKEGPEAGSKEDRETVAAFLREHGAV